MCLYFLLIKKVILLIFYIIHKYSLNPNTKFFLEMWRNCRAFRTRLITI